MSTLNVHLVGTTLNAECNTYTQSQTDSGINQDQSSLELNQLNALVLDDPGSCSRHVYSINISDFLPLLVSSDSSTNGYYQSSESVGICYSCNKKINEANMPYIHGELINKGSVPSCVLPYTNTLGSDASGTNLLTKKAALGYASQMARAITFENGWFNLWGYGDDGKMYITSSAQLFKVDADTETIAALGDAYPIPSA